MPGHRWCLAKLLHTESYLYFHYIHQNQIFKWFLKNICAIVSQPTFEIHTGHFAKTPNKRFHKTGIKSKKRPHRLVWSLFGSPCWTCFFLQKISPSYCCGARQLLRLTKQTRTSPTAATRSGRSSCHRQRSPRSLPPSHAQSVSQRLIHGSIISSPQEIIKNTIQTDGVFYWLPLLDLNQRPAD